MHNKKRLLNLFFKMGGDKLLLSFNRCPRVFCYHGVDNITDKDIETESIPVELFLQQIDFISKNFEIISISEFDCRYRMAKLTGMEAIITFDDGYENIIRIVDPILQERKIPYTVFISTQNITTGELFATSINRLVVRTDAIDRLLVPSLGIDERLVSHDKKMELSNIISNYLKSADISKVEKVSDELLADLPIGKIGELMSNYSSVKPMNWSQIKELSQREGVTIGSHCCRHICCHGNQDIKIVESEIVESKRIIEERIGKECKYFAYPNGSFTNESNDIVRNVYSMGFSIVAEERIDYNNDIAVIPRLYVFGNDINTFKQFVSRYPMRRLV